MDRANDLIGKVFKSSITGEEYGVFRLVSANRPSAYSYIKFGKPVLSDGYGNFVTVSRKGEILFWDHETDEVVTIATSWNEFRGGCTEPEEVELRPGQLISAWIDPEFAKEMNIDAPSDGWTKKQT